VFKNALARYQVGGVLILTRSFAFVIPICFDYLSRSVAQYCHLRISYTADSFSAHISCYDNQGIHIASCPD